MRLIPSFLKAVNKLGDEEKSEEHDNETKEDISLFNFIL